MTTTNTCTNNASYKGKLFFSFALLANFRLLDFKAILLKNKGKQPRSKRTIETILDAAAQVLIEQGYDKATTNKIADKSGYSVGTLYQYFDDKEDVYREVTEHQLDKVLAVVNATDIKATLSDTLATMTAQIMEQLGNDPLLLRSVGQLIVGPFQQLRNRGRTQTVAAVIRVLEAHRDEITVPDLQQAADTIVSATEGFAVNAGSSAIPAEVILEHAVRLQLAYLTMPWQGRSEPG